MGLFDGLFGGGGSKKEKAPSAKQAGFKLPSPEEIQRYLVPIGTNANPGYPGVGSTMNLFPGASSHAAQAAGASQGLMGLQNQNQGQGLDQIARLAMAAAMFAGGGGMGGGGGAGAGGLGFEIPGIPSPFDWA